ncbi:glycoside hydrolase family 18 protein, partial [Glonium stellatum]
CWVNTVKEVEIQLYCEQVGETARSHYIATSEIDHHESSELREYAPRIICYHQTHHKNDGQHISLRPLVSENTGVTHVIIAAIHLNESYGDITLNNDSTSSPKFDSLWKDIKYLQASGIKILAMLGGAAPGSFTKLDGSDENFEFYYEPLLDVLRNQHFDGIDLDVEENMSLEGIIRLIDRLRTDLGSDFLITLAPVATALIGQPHLSGFDYETLENLRGNEISWYNTQFYCGWSKLPSMESYGEIAAKGWPMRKVVVGLSTNPSNATGYIDLQELENALLTWGLPSENKFGGFMGWEYFNSLPGGLQQPWQWASQVSTLGPTKLGLGSVLRQISQSEL